MSTPAYLVIADSLPFTVDNVRSGRTGEPLPEATVTYALIDKETRAAVTSGSMELYDEPSASFEAAIPDTELAVYDAGSNPGGLVPNRRYLLRSTVDNGGVKTSKAVELVALLDPPAEESA